MTCSRNVNGNKILISSIGKPKIRHDFVKVVLKQLELSFIIKQNPLNYD